MTRLQTALEAGKLASTVVENEFEAPMLKQLCLLTSKPILYILNKKAGGKNLDEMKGSDGSDDIRWKNLMDFLKSENNKWVIVDAGIENELKDMSADEKLELREGLGAKDDGIDNLIKKGYELLDLITYFTTGEDETRAWTIKRGWNAPMAGTAIHTDFKEKFIKAEVIEWETLLKAGSYGNAREKGTLRTEGKEYIVKDGDVIEFKI